MKQLWIDMPGGIAVAFGENGRLISVKGTEQ
jgi:hypothetical protein